MGLSQHAASGAPCTACGYRNVPDARACGLCGEFLVAAALSSPAPARRETPAVSLPRGTVPSESAVPAAPAIAPAGAPVGRVEPVELPVGKPRVPDPVAEREGLDEVRELVRTRAAQHGWTGVTIAFLVLTLFGIPDALRPAALGGNAVAAAIFGFPLAHLASRGRLGMIRGALLGGAFGVTLALIGVGIFALGAVTLPLGAILFAVTRGLFAGILAGALIGLHVESDV